MFRKMYQGGSSKKQGPMPAIRERDYELPREAQVRPCEWPSENFMVQAGIRMNLTRMCVVLNSRASFQISALNSTT